MFSVRFSGASFLIKAHVFQMGPTSLAGGLPVCPPLGSGAVSIDGGLSSSPLPVAAPCLHRCRFVFVFAVW